MIPKDRPYLIAETAYNHQGDFEYLYQMTSQLVNKADAIKFHLLLDINHYMHPNHPLYSKLKKWIFTKSQWEKIFNLCISHNMDVIALCDDPESLKFILERYPKITAIELHSSGLNDLRLLRLAKEYQQTIILGIGGSSIEEISFAIEQLKPLEANKDLLLMYGFQNYPTSRNKLQFHRMIQLRSFFNLPFGYADHCKFDDELNFIISALPLCFGINVIEKHVTLDKGVNRIDYQSAISINELSEVKRYMQIFWDIYGYNKLTMTKDESLYGEIGNNKKIPCYIQDIEAGSTLSLSNIIYLRTNYKYRYNQKIVKELLGLSLKRSKRKGDPIEVEDFEVND